MTRKTIVAALALSSAAGLAFGQASSPSRADVKAETRAAEKAGKLTPAGQGTAPKDNGAVGTSTKTREERKAETRAAAKNKELTPAGPQHPAQKADAAARNQPSTTTREERKAETKAAAKAGELTPAGEGPLAPKK
jgi:hypothetical protein